MAGRSIANKEDASLRAGKGDRAGWREKDKCSFMIQCLYITPCKDGKTPRSGPLGIHGPSQFTKSDVPPSTPRYPHSTWQQRAAVQHRSQHYRLMLIYAAAKNVS